MQRLLYCLCLIHSLFYLHAASDSCNSTRSPKLGPTIVEKQSAIKDDLKIVSLGINTCPADVGVGNENCTIYSNFLCNRTIKQRLQIADAFFNVNKVEIAELKKRENTSASRSNMALDLYSTMSNLIGEAYHYDDLFSTVEQYLAKNIKLSLLHGHDLAYMSILCTSSDTTLRALIDARYILDPENHPDITITLQTLINTKVNSKDERRVLNSIINPITDLRPECGVNPALIQDQLKLIPRKDRDCKSTHEELLKFMTKASFDQIKAVDDEYRKQNHGATVLQQIENHCEGYVREAYRRIVYYAVDPFAYFADQVFNGINDPYHGFIENATSIVAYSRSEIDLKDIEAAFQIIYKRPVLDFLQDAKWNDPYQTLLYFPYRLYKGNT